MTKSYYYAFFTFTIGVLVLELVIFLFVRKSKKVLSKSILIALSPIYFLICVGAIAYVQFLDPAKFDEAKWKESIEKPTEMARSLIWNNELEASSKKEISTKLGSDYISEYSNNSRFAYRLTAGRFAYLVIDFGNLNKVEKVYFMYWD
jgi:hypothetical protein